MKAILKSVTVLAALTSLALADGTDPKEAKDLKKQIEDQAIYVETAKPGIVLSGYVDAGWTDNFEGAGSVAAGGVATREGTDNLPGSNFNLNAFKFALEKPLSSKDEFTAGFRADLIYGSDATRIDNATGVGGTLAGGPAGTAAVNSSSDLLVEQAFVQFRAPVGNGIDFKVGKFVTPLGYEVIERPSNQNISYGNIFVNLIPTDHTGVLASYTFNDIINVSAGVTDGWNTGSAYNVGTTGAGKSGTGLIGTVNINAPGGNANIQTGAYVGLDPAGNKAQILAGGTAGSYIPTNNTTWVWDTWGQWKPKITGSNLTLGFEGDLGQYTDANPLLIGVPDETSTFTGAALYAKYQFTKIFALSTRTDWIHNNDAQKFGAGSTATFANPVEDIYSWTLTSEFDVWENMLLRAEYRLDWGDDLGTFGSTAVGVVPSPVNSYSKGPAQLVDLEVVYSF